MKKEHIMSAMDYIDPALVAGVDERGRARRKTHWLRPALVAACLCLALVGTAFAVQQFSVRVDMNGSSDPAYDGYDMANYTISGGVAYYPVNSFSQEVRDLATRGAAKSFQSWDELEQFIGRNLMDNPVLEAGVPGVPTKSDTMEGKVTHIQLCPSNDQSGELFSLLILDSYYVDEVWVNRQTRAYTDRAQAQYEEYGYEPEIVHFYEKGSQVAQEEYTTPGGLTAAIVQVEDGLAATYQASFSINGTQCTLSATPKSAGCDTLDNPAHTLEILKTVLDGFDPN